MLAVILFRDGTEKTVEFDCAALVWDNGTVKTAHHDEGHYHNWKVWKNVASVTIGVEKEGE